MITNSDMLLRELIALDREALQLERSERRQGNVRLLIVVLSLGLFVLL
jgi:hypothetical protein